MNARAAFADIDSVVNAAWSRIVDGSIDGLARAWEDTGADSLQAMHLLLELETALACKLSFDLLGPRTTAASLTSALERHVARASISALPTVFLLPGLLGDEPRLAAFRRAFEGSIHFELIDLPGLEESSAVTTRLPASGAFAADAIEALAPAGELMIAGYSFGGSIAFEAAHRLRERGRKVAMLGILDLVMHDPSVVEPAHGWKHRVIGRLARSDALRPLAVAIIGRLWPRKLAATRREMMAHLRVTALRSWQPHAIAAPTFCAMSLETAAYQEARWPALCSDLRAVLRLPVGHLEIFDADAMALMVPAFASTRAALAGS